jgi:diguanylate cyclase (GGDEF)-like protein
MVRDQEARRLAITLITWCLLSFGIGIAALAYTQRLAADATEAAYARAEAISVVAEQTWRTSFESIRNAMELLLLRHRLIEYGGEGGATALELTLREMANARYQGVVGFSEANLAGRVTWSTGTHATGADVSQRGSFQALGDGSGRDRAITRPRRDDARSPWRIELFRSIPDAYGGMAAVGIVTIDPLVLNRALAGLISSPAQVVTIHRRRDGALRAITRDPDRYFGLPPIAGHPVIAAAREAPAGRLAFNAVTDGQPMFVAYRVTEALDMVVATHIESAAALAEAGRAGSIVLAAAAALVLALLAVLLAWCRAATLQDRLHDQAMRDPLTGLYNRRSMVTYLEPLLRGPCAPPLAVLLFDLDHFKAINDRHGHAVGDMVLRDVAALLRGAVRRGDLVCRWGGEELLVVLAECPASHARTRAEHLREAIAMCYDGQAGPVRQVTASVGVACFPDEGESLDRLIEAADAALYRAKAAGRNRVELLLEAA